MFHGARVVIKSPIETARDLCRSKSVYILLLNCVQSRIKDQSVYRSARALAIYKAAQKDTTDRGARPLGARAAAAKRDVIPQRPRGWFEKNRRQGPVLQLRLITAWCAINNSRPLAGVRSRMARKSHGDYTDDPRGPSPSALVFVVIFYRLAKGARKRARQKHAASVSSESYSGRSALARDETCPLSSRLGNGLKCGTDEYGILRRRWSLHARSFHLDGNVEAIANASYRKLRGGKWSAV